MQVSATGVLFIEENESFTSTVKGDTGGKQKIGYGHDLLPGEAFPNGISEEQAEVLLLRDLISVEETLNTLVPSTCTQNQFDALADFTYECGTEALKQLMAHGWSQVTVQLPRWVHARVHGVEQVLPGMVTRREKDVALFNNPNQPMTAA